MKNTLKSSNIRFVLFQDKKVWYGVGLEFNIVVSANTREQAFFELGEALVGYVQSLRKLKGHRKDGLEKLLNQAPQKEYLEIWKKLTSGESIKSPYKFATAGSTLVNA